MWETANLLPALMCQVCKTVNVLSSFLKPHCRTFQGGNELPDTKQAPNDQLDTDYGIQAGGYQNNAFGGALKIFKLGLGKLLRYRIASQL